MVYLPSQMTTYRWVRMLSLLTLLVVGIPLSIFAQNPALVISGEPSTDCRIILTPVATLGDAEGPGWIGGISTITKLTDGRYALSDNSDSYLIKIFAADGRYLQTVGGRGQGPGEFGYIKYLLAHDDRLYVFDISTMRISTYSSDLELLRTVPFQIRSSHDVAVISDSLMVLNTTLRHPDRIDYLLHLIDQDGNTLHSIAKKPDGRPEDQLGRIYDRKVARSSSGGIWVLHRTRYQLEEWSITGNLLRTIDRRISWFPDYPVDREGIMRDDQRRRMPWLLWPTSRGIREDNNGLLWIAVTVHDPDWPDYVTVTGSMEGERAEVHDSQRAYDTIIEVIDLQAGTLLASTRFDQSIYRFISIDEMISSSQEEDGSSRVHVWRLSLQYPTSGKY